MRLRSDDAEIVYEVAGTGPPVVFLHPFPAHRGFWAPVVPALETRYQLILPDLRGPGDSETGNGPAFRERPPRAIARALDKAGVGRAAFVGGPSGGYILFDFWRRFRERVPARALCDPRPKADT